MGTDKLKDKGKAGFYDQQIIATGKRSRSKMTKKIIRAIELFGPPFTVLGLALAAFQIFQANKQGADIKEIAGAISTQYVGTFPDNIEPIVKLIESTRKILWIVTDVPAYGHFSQPGAHAAYWQAIEKFLPARPDKVFRILSYNSKARRRFAPEQINVKDLEELKRRESFKRFYEFWPKKAYPTKLDDFFENLERENVEFLRQLIRLGAEPYETTTDSPLPVFMWLSDDRQAIFSFFNYGANAREVSFRTNDPRLINVLKEIAENAFESARKVQMVGEKEPNHS